MPRLPLAVSATVLALTGALLHPASATPTAPRATAPDIPAQVVAPVPDLDWKRCDRDSPGIQCATAPVPLDYDNPEGATVDLDLLRIPAGDPGARIGTLFLNPGGPGGSSRDFALFFGELVPKAVSQRFDVVGIDPRGVGPSAPMVCRTDEERPRFPRAFFPTDKAQAKVQIRFGNWIRNACAEGPSRIVNHMTTADTARDMDLIRQAVGEEQLTYYGISYGTQLGTTYAAMFPDRIRAMILDGVLDPVAWSGPGDEPVERPFSERLGSGVGAYESMVAALRKCDDVGESRCRFAGNAPRKWKRILDRLEQEPFETRDGKITYDAVVGTALGSLYDQRGVPFLMTLLDRLHRQMFERKGRVLVGAFDPDAALRRATRARGIVAPYAPAFARTSEPFLGVACADSDNPADPRAWIRAGNRADETSPWFGKLWTWASSPCASWPEATKADRFTGPYDVATSEPVLVVGNTYDPATPIHGARAVNDLLAGSVLLQLDGWGHGAIGNGDCIAAAFRAYLVGGTLPETGTVCAPGGPLFPRRG